MTGRRLARALVAAERARAAGDITPALAAALASGLGGALSEPARGEPTAGRQDAAAIQLAAALIQSGRAVSSGALDPALAAALCAGHATALLITHKLDPGEVGKLMDAVADCGGRRAGGGMENDDERPSSHC